MLRRCLSSLLLYIAFAAGYFYWFNQVFDPPGSYIGAAVVGLLSLCCVGALINAWIASKDRALVRTAEHYVPPSDGALMAVAGPIHPVDQPLIAPFSGTECVLCEIEISTRSLGNKPSEQQKQVEYAGFLMNPCVVRGHQGNIRVLGFPQLDDTHPRLLRGPAATRRALDFLRSAEVDDLSGTKIVSVFSALQDVMTDDDGKVNRIVRMRKPDGTLLGADVEDFLRQPSSGPVSADEDRTLDEDESEEDDEDDFTASEIEPEWPTLSEKAVGVGAMVCVIGRYDAAQSGLLPAAHGAGRMNRLIPGTVEDVAARLGRACRGYFFGGLIGLLALHGAIFGVMFLYKRSPDTLRKQREALVKAVEQNDLDKLQQLVQRGADLNTRDDSGRTLLLLAREPQTTAWLIEQGIDVNAADNEGMTPLMEAARLDRLAIVDQLIAAGADLNARHNNYKSTALIMADGSERFAVAARLRQAGAEDDVVTAENGQRLNDLTDEPIAAALAYHGAIHAGDLDKLRASIAQASPADFNEDDLKNWQGARPSALSKAVGFVKDDRATVWLTGPTPGGFTACWCLQLVREQGGWKVLRERWVVQGASPP